MENVRKLVNETSSVTKAACSSINLVVLRYALQRYVAMQSDDSLGLLPCHEVVCLKLPINLLFLLKRFSLLGKVYIFSKG